MLPEVWSSIWEKLHYSLVKSKCLIYYCNHSDLCKYYNLNYLQAVCSVSGRKCPSCNVKANCRDIRVLYAKTLIALDTTERDRLMNQLQTVGVFPDPKREMSFRTLIFYIFTDGNREE